jgi:CRISPR-associated endonuclease Csn1
MMAGIDPSEKAAADEARREVEAFAEGKQDRKRLLAGIPDPWDGFLGAVKEKAGAIIVSHKPDHGIQGKLHEDTNYGLVKTQDGETRLATRKPITDLTPNEIRNIGDNKIREDLI